MCSVIINLHRLKFSEAWWLGLIWLLQWGLCLLLVILTFFYDVKPDAKRAGHVRVRPQRFLFAYALVFVGTTIVLLIGQWSHRQSSNNALFLFLTFYRITTFCLLACFMRVWLAAYRPKWTHKVRQRK